MGMITDNYWLAYDAERSEEGNCKFWVNIDDGIMSSRFCPVFDQIEGCCFLLVDGEIKNDVGTVEDYVCWEMAMVWSEGPHDEFNHN